MEIRVLLDKVLNVARVMTPSSSNTLSNMYLAVNEDTRKRVFSEEAGQTLIEDGIIRFQMHAYANLSRSAQINDLG